MTASHVLFTYGPLMRGEARGALLDGRLFLGGGSCAGALRDVGVEGQARQGGLLQGPTAPGLVRAGEGRVSGELFAVDDGDLARLDAAEGSAWRRERVTVRPGNDGPEMPAWAYVLADNGAGAAITDGRWAGPGRRWRGGSLWYFAYASNMWRMAERRKLDVLEQHRARIDNYLIASVADSGDGQHAYGHVFPRRGAAVEGMLYRLWEQQTAAEFDVQEKVGTKMRRCTFAVEYEGGRVFAEVYIALPERIVWGRPQHPDNAVKILDGARDCALPPDYVAFLERFLKKPADPTDYDARAAW